MSLILEEKDQEIEGGCITKKSMGNLKTQHPHSLSSVILTIINYKTMVTA